MSKPPKLNMNGQEFIHHLFDELLKMGLLQDKEVYQAIEAAYLKGVEDGKDEVEKTLHPVKKADFVPRQYGVSIENKDGITSVKNSDLGPLKVGTAYCHLCHKTIPIDDIVEHTKEHRKNTTL
jgi:hypothetical protein